MKRKNKAQTKGSFLKISIYLLCVIALFIGIHYFQEIESNESEDPVAKSEPVEKTEATISETIDQDVIIEPRTLKNDDRKTEEILLNQDECKDLEIKQLEHHDEPRSIDENKGDSNKKKKLKKKKNKPKNTIVNSANIILINKEESKDNNFHENIPTEIKVSKAESSLNVEAKDSNEIISSKSKPNLRAEARVFIPKFLRCATSTDNLNSKETKQIINAASMDAQIIEPPQVIVQNPEFFSIIDADDVDTMKLRITFDWKETNSLGYNALHYAAMNSKTKILKYLLEKVVPRDEVDIFCSDGYTALHLACLYERIEAVNILSTHRADVNNHVADSATLMTPLIIAVEKGNEQLVKVLTEKGANVNEILEESNESVLHSAMKSCKRPIIKELLDHGADVNAINGLNRFPIHEAAAQGCVEGLKELILTRRISKNSCSPESSREFCTVEDKGLCLFMATPLHYAAKENKLEAVEFLLFIQAAANVKDESMQTASKYAQGNVLKYFIDRKAWEGTRTEIQDVENLMRYCESLEVEDSLDYFNHLKRYHLHNKPPVPGFVDNIQIPKLNEYELNFLKRNVSGMEDISINTRTGDKILSKFFKLRRKKKIAPEIDFVSGLSKNMMKQIEINHIVFKF